MLLAGGDVEVGLVAGLSPTVGCNVGCVVPAAGAVLVAMVAAAAGGVAGAGELRDLFVAFPAEGTSVIVTEDSGGGVGVGVGAVVVAGVVGTGICSS